MSRHPNVFVETLLDREARPRDVSVLNAVKSPALWGRLRERTLSGDLVLEARELLGRIAKDVGAKLEISTAASSWGRRDLSRRFWIGSRDSRVPLLEALESILERISLTFLADSEQIRIVTLDEGLDFWKGWGKREEEKRK